MAKNPNWTPTEVTVLERFSLLESDQELARRLPGRSSTAIKHKRLKLRPPEKRRRIPQWTQEEIALVLTYWGLEPREKTAARVSRSTYAVRKKLHVMFGSGSIVRGRWTVNKLINYSGYDHYQINKAIDDLGIQAKRHLAGVGYRPWRILSEGQAVRILQWLKERTVMPSGRFLSRGGNPTNRWARFWDRCRRCETDGTERRERHCSRGLCETCHRVLYRAGRLEDYPVGHDRKVGRRPKSE